MGSGRNYLSKTNVCIIDLRCQVSIKRETEVVPPHLSLKSEFQMVPKILSSLVVSALALTVLGGCVRAQAQSAAPQLSTGKNLYALLLERELPAIAPRPIVVSRFKALVPKYDDVQGLRTKYFFISDRKTYGGVYLWTDKASADAYLSSPLLASISANAKGERRVTRFEIPLAIDGPAAATADVANGKAVARIVRITPPPGTPREAIIAGFEKAVPTYQKVPGLIHKWFSIAEDGRFGGIYLFTDSKAADAWFNQAWHDRVKATYGVDGDVATFDAPVIIEK